MRTLLLSLLLACALAFGCVAFDKSVVNVSMIELIANPGFYDGKHVRVQGFVTVGFENTYVYLHHDDARYNIMDNSMGLIIPKSVYHNKKAYEKYRVNNGRYVLMEGTFVAKYNKLGKLWTRSIKDITRFEAWGPPVPLTQ